MTARGRPAGRGGVRRGSRSSRVAARPRAAPPGADEDAIARLVESLAVLLDAGLSPSAAWMLLEEDAEGPDGHRGARRVARRIAQGRTPGEALVEASVEDRSLAVLTVAWLVAEGSGAPLARSLRGLAEALRDRAETAREVDVALSGPRATARLVGSLPPVGAAMAAALGVDVLGALTGSAAGWMLLASGLGLWAGGRAWTRSLVRSASEPAPVAGAGAELLTIALASGMSVDGARSLVAQSLARVSAPAVEPAEVGRALHLASRAGAPAADLLTAGALQERRMARAEGRRAATALGVRLLLPVGVCVLPSFVALGVAPVVLALVSSTVAGL